MAKSLEEYLEWLGGRRDLIWPKPPAPKPLKATPYLKRLPGIRAVTWSVYGTLLRIDQGRLFHMHPQPLRMQIALEKTIEEFKMWQSMSRKPGAPWEYMLQQYQRLVEEEQLKPTRRKGDVREVDSAVVWGKLIDRLLRNEYEYDMRFYGELDEFAEKVSYFFHANLQGVAAEERACETLRALSTAGIRVGLIDDGQPFTSAQLLSAFQAQSTLNSLNEVMTSTAVTLSFREGVKKPSPSLFAAGSAALVKEGIKPEEILHVSHRLEDDLAVAREFGVRTALFAADAETCRVSHADLRDPVKKPDRLLTKLSQIGEVLGL